MKYALGDARVQTDGDQYWIAPNAVVIGNVILKKDASIWWNCVVRGDNDPITVGENSQIQDGCVVHADPGFPCTIGDNVSIGHMVMLHGCTIEEESLIGIGSIVLNGAHIGKRCLIGAGAMIPEGKEIPDNSIVFGSPGRVVKQISEKHLEMLQHIPGNYARRWKLYKEILREDGY